MTFAAHGRTTLMRLEQVGEEHVRPSKATRADPDARSVPPVEEELRPPPQPGQPIAPVFWVMDLPAIDSAPAHAPRLAAYAKPWTPMAVFRSRDGGAFVLDQVLETPATIGRLTAPLGAHASGRFDRTNALLVEIGPDRTLESVTEAALFAGANLAAVRGEGGGWEVLQFRDAALVGPGFWRLTTLLRGQAGTEDCVASPAPVDSAFVLLDDRTSPSALPEGDRGLDILWSAGPAVRPRDDDTYVSALERAGGRGLLPLSPVHLSARRNPATGDVTLRWIRRTRVGADDFDAREAPLGEEREAYEVEVLAGGVAVRTVEVSTPVFVYGAAEQTADFGALPGAIELRVRQISAVVGAGVPATATLVF